MDIFPLTHESGDKEVAFRRMDNSVLVTIGAFSYVSELTICDYSNGEPLGTPAAAFDIGRFCSIGSGIEIILGGVHDYRQVTTSPLIPIVNDHRAIPARPQARIEIGNDVWIGNNALILSGSKIGDGAVIGAGSVIAGDIPPFAVVIGNPARVIKYRFPEEIIQSLMEIRWWDWDIERIRTHLDDIRSHDIEGFIQKARSLYP